MTIELAPGELRELNVAMQPVAGPGDFEILPYVYMVDLRLDANEVEFVAICPVKNTGAAAATHTVTCHAILYDVFPQPQHKTFTHTLTIEPGETGLYYFPHYWGVGAKGEIWFVADWGEETRKMTCTFGRLLSSGVELVPVEVGPDWVTLRYAQRYSCNRWDFYCGFPGLSPYLRWGLRWKTVQNHWTAIHTMVSGLVPGREHEARCQGSDDGFGAQWGICTFSTP